MSQTMLYLVEGKDLPAMDYTGKSDPFINVLVLFSSSSFLSFLFLSFYLFLSLPLFFFFFFFFCLDHCSSVVLSPLRPFCG